MDREYLSLRENIQVEQLQPAAGAGDAAGVPRGALRHAGPRPALRGPGGAAQSGTDTIHHQPSRDWESCDPGIYSTSFYF